MRRFPFIVLWAVLLFACSKNNNDLSTSPITKVADYLYLYDADNYGTQPPSQLLTDTGFVPFGCSTVRNGNFYGRNFDFNINELCEFVVRTHATPSRKHASIGVSNTIFATITHDMIAAGLSEQQLNLIPWTTMDGINDAGLVCNSNVVNMADLGPNKHEHTNPGQPKIMALFLVRAILDNCATVQEAKDFINSHDILPLPSSWDLHLMIADPSSTVVVEFTGDKGNEVKFTNANIMTNFYNYQYAASGKFPAHACGIERYNILRDGYSNSNSMEGMWQLLKSVRYTQAYLLDTDPFWCSEYYEVVPNGDTSWTKEMILQQEMPQIEIAAYQHYLATGQYDPKNNLWFTTHNSTYDIANRSLWVTIREKYDKRYEFKL